MTELHVTLFEGMPRTGKTTLALRYLATPACPPVRFVFDPLGIMAATCGLVAAETEAELECALEEGACFFDCSTAFPGNRTAGFDWFSRWSLERARALAGRKLLFVDEVWKHCSPQAIPPALAEWVQDGAKWNCECLFATQTPNKLNSSIAGQLTEAVCFRLQEKNALEFNAGLGFDIEELRALQPGSFVALNLYSGGVRRGRVF